MTLFRLLPALLLGLAVPLPLANGADQTPAAPDNHAEERQILDLDLARFSALIQQDDDPATKTNLRSYQQEYARRANLLFQNFDSKKYDDLRYDINVQCQRQARKLAPLAILPRSARNEGAAEIALYRLNPSPANKADVAAALDAVDAEIKRMEDRLGRMTIGAHEREVERLRLQRVKDRRIELGRSFSKAGWDALISEMKPRTP